LSFTSLQEEFVIVAFDVVIFREWQCRNSSQKKNIYIIMEDRWTATMTMMTNNSVVDDDYSADEMTISDFIACDKIMECCVRDGCAVFHDGIRHSPSLSLY
jgi:hypothetical protein